MKCLRLGFLASHNGSNMQAIIDACKSGKLQAIPSVVISNNADSMALQRARGEKIPAFHLSQKSYSSPEELDEVMLRLLQKYRVDLVILAGYMKLMGKKVLAKYRDRVLNIHPALLPKFGGKGMYGSFVHEAVIKAKEKITGVTVHLVDEQYDHGSILAQIKVPVLAGDTALTLGERVLKEEHKIYAETIQKIAMGEIDLAKAALK